MKPALVDSDLLYKSRKLIVNSLVYNIYDFVRKYIFYIGITIITLIYLYYRYYDYKKNKDNISYNTYMKEIYNDIDKMIL